MTSVQAPVRVPPPDLRGTPDSSTHNESSRISAYARLDFENYTFFVQTLQVVLGRKVSDEDLVGAAHSVDVHLSSKKAILRRHAKIFYNFGTQQFELLVMGRNGAFVDNVFVTTGVTVPLADGTKIQIGDIPLTFVLPSVESHDADVRAEGGRLTNPADALNLRRNLYLASNLPKRPSSGNSEFPRRSLRADIMHRLSVARKKSLSSASSDEIDALIHELETGNPDLDTLDAEVRQILAKSSPHSQHVTPMDALDQELASLSPLLDASMVDPLLRAKGPPVASQGPRMGKPAPIQPPASRFYGTYSPYTSQSGMFRAPAPRLTVTVETIVPTPAPLLTAPYRAFSQPPPRNCLLERAPVCVFRPNHPAPPFPRLPVRREPRRAPKTATPLKDIPDQFKMRPAFSVPVLISSVMRSGPAKKGYTMAEIHNGIRLLFPYYQFCADGWQAAVTHHLRFNKMFSVTKRASVLESEWVWDIDDKYVGEKETVRKLLQAAAVERAAAAAERARQYAPVGYGGANYSPSTATAHAYTAGSPQNYTAVGPGLTPAPASYTPAATQPPQYNTPPPQYSSPRHTASTQAPPPPQASIAELASKIKREPFARALPPVASVASAPPPQAANPSIVPGPISKPPISSASPSPSPQMAPDTRKLLAYLQKELLALYKARGLAYNTADTTQIITKALATTIAQVNAVGAKAGCGDNSLTFLVERAPQQVSKILDIALTKLIREHSGRSGTDSARQLPAPSPSGSATPSKGLTRPLFGLNKSVQGKSLSNPPQFISNKKRPGEDDGGSAKMARTE